MMTGEVRTGTGAKIIATSDYVEKPLCRGNQLPSVLLTTAFKNYMQEAIRRWSPALATLN
jgi:hypothetical protein